jgi:hypothetical protein
MKKLLLFAAFACFQVALSAQYNGGPRLFLDIPSIYLHTPDVSKIGNVMGAGAEAAMNVGTHWSVARLGGGTTFTLDPKSNDLGSTMAWTPYALLEAGAGMYRSNGNQCAKTKQNAFTAMGKAGLRYNFVGDARGGGLDYSVGAEFGYFYIRDVFKNFELLTSANYFIESKTVAVNFGFKTFLNLRADRD